LLDICFSFLYNLSPSCDGKRQNTEPLEEGLMEEARALGEMNANMVLLGFLIIIICRDIVAVTAFKRSVRKGILCACCSRVHSLSCKLRRVTTDEALDRLAGWSRGDADGLHALTTPCFTGHVGLSGRILSGGSGDTIIENSVWETIQDADKGVRKGNQEVIP
jgi:hypothetical protein